MSATKPEATSAAQNPTCEVDALAAATARRALADIDVMRHVRRTLGQILRAGVITLQAEASHAQ